MDRSKESNASIAADTRLTAVLEKYRAELEAIPKQEFVNITISRERMLALTDRVVTNMREHEPTFEQEIAPARAAQRRAELKRLPERAQVFFAADLLSAAVYTPAEEREWNELRTRVAEHDRVLFKWASPLFGDDAELKSVLDDIQAGTGHQDSAEDVVRLVVMFRDHWPEADGQTPITREYLDRAEIDATRMLDLLENKAGAEARDLARRAFTAWAHDYRELISLGRYLERSKPDVLTRFPGIHAERTRARRPGDQPDGGDPAGDTPGNDGGDDGGAGAPDTGGAGGAGNAS